MTSPSPSPLLRVGARATVQGKGMGVVRFMGETKFAVGTWVGIELDEAQGKNDGSVQGIRYFTCEANHGLCVKPQQVLVLEQEDQLLNIPNTPPQPHSPIPSSPLLEIFEDPNNKKASTSNSKLLGTIKELSEGKQKAEAHIASLQQQLDNLTKTTAKEAGAYRKEKLRIEKEWQARLASADTAYQKEIAIEKQNLEDRVCELEETIEMITLDKELAEARVEDQEKTIAELNHTITTSKSHSLPPTELGSAELLRQNEELRAALTKLRDLSFAERQAHLKTMYELESTTKLASAHKEKMDQQTAHIDELLQAVDDAIDSQILAERLTAQNLELEERVEELKQAVEDLEALRNVSEELEHNQGAIERQLRSEIYVLEVQVISQEEALRNKQAAFEQSVSEILKYRELVRSQQERLEAMELYQAELDLFASRRKTDDLSLRDKNILLQKQAGKIRAVHIDRDLLRLELTQAKDQYAFLSAVIPENVPNGPDFQAEMQSFQLMLTLKRVAFKCALIDDTLSRDENLSQTGHSTAGFQPYKGIQFMATAFHTALDACSANVYHRGGTYHSELVSLEGILDQSILLLKSDYSHHHLLLDQTSPPSKGLQRVMDRLEEIIHSLFDEEAHPLNMATVAFKQIHELHQIVHEIAASGSDETTQNLGVTTDNSYHFPASEAQAVLSGCVRLLRVLRQSTVGALPEYIGSLQRLCANAATLRDSTRVFVQHGQNSQESWDWLATPLQEIFNFVSSMCDEWILVSPSTASSKQQLPQRRNQIADSIREALTGFMSVKSQLAEAKAALALQEEKCIKAEKTVQIIRREAREREEVGLQRIAELRNSETQLLEKMWKEEEQVKKKVKHYEEHAVVLQRDREIYDAELRKSKANITYLEGKVKELMEISGNQKRQLLTQGSTVPVTLMASEISAQQEAIRALSTENLEIKARKLSSIISTFTPLSTAPLDVGSNKGAHQSCMWDTVSDPQDVTTWVRESLHLMADVRVVNIGQKRNTHKFDKHPDAHIYTQKLQRLIQGGKSMRDRACATLGQHGEDPNAFNFFPPPHVVKQLEQIKHKGAHSILGGRITLPCSESSGPSYPLHDLVGSSHKIVLDNTQFAAIHACFGDQIQ